VGELQALRERAGLAGARVPLAGGRHVLRGSAQPLLDRQVALAELLALGRRELEALAVLLDLLDGVALRYEVALRVGLGGAAAERRGREGEEDEGSSLPVRDHAAQ